MLVDGRLSFDALQRRMVTSPAKARQLVAAVPASFVAFDLLAVAGVDLRSGGLSAADAWRSSPPVGRPRCS